MSAPVAIVAVLYEEPEYAETRDAIARCAVPTIWQSRKGVGSLVTAYNQGFRKAQQWAPEFVWFVSNPVFSADVLPRLLHHMALRIDFAAIQPTYNSDHQPLIPDGSGEIKEVRFVEFTCPLVRSEVYARIALDEAMPYWGHDLDWGHRVRADGWKLGADHGCTVRHEYIRHAKKRRHPVTVKRARERERTNAATEAALIDRYGPGYPQLLGWAR